MQTGKVLGFHSIEEYAKPPQWKEIYFFPPVGRRLFPTGCFLRMFLGQPILSGPKTDIITNWNVIFRKSEKLTIFPSPKIVAYFQQDKLNFTENWNVEVTVSIVRKNQVIIVGEIVVNSCAIVDNGVQFTWKNIVAR